jgi:replicative DNA helicase
MMHAAENESISELEKKNFILEEKILGCLIAGYVKVEEFPEEYFVAKKNQNVRRGIENLIKNNLDVNQINIANLLVEKTGQGSWREVVASMCTESTSDPQSIDLFSNMREKNDLCIRALHTNKSIIDGIQNSDENQLMGAINALSNLKVTNKKESFSFYEAAMSSVQTIIESRKNGAPLSFPSNIKEIDDAMGGYFPSDFVVIAGRPSMGKTTYATFMSHEADCPMGFISSEMQKESLANKLLSTSSGISVELMRRTHLLTDEQVVKIEKAVDYMKNKELYINEKGDISISEIEKQAQEWVEMYNVKVIFVDYLQRINHDDDSKSKVEQIGDIAKRLKNIAKKYSITVVGLAQINRDSEKRGSDSASRRPNISDLKGSGDIEQEADVIIMLHRDSYGKSTSNESSKIELIFGKNRQGRIGIVEQLFVPEKCSYCSLPDNYSPINF